MKNQIIIITQNEEEVKQINPNFSNVGFWGHQILNYNTEWHWILDSGKLSGTSGWHSLQHAISRFKDAPILTVKQFCDLTSQSFEKTLSISKIDELLELQKEDIKAWLHRRARDFGGISYNQIDEFIDDYQITTVHKDLTTQTVE